MLLGAFIDVLNVNFNDKGRFVIYALGWGRREMFISVNFSVPQPCGIQK